MGEGGEPGGMQALGRAITSVPLGAVAGTQPQGMQGPTLNGMGVQTGLQVPQPVGATITTYQPSGWTWGQVIVTGLAGLALAYGAYRAYDWWRK